MRLRSYFSAAGVCISPSDSLRRPRCYALFLHLCIPPFCTGAAGVRPVRPRELLPANPSSPLGRSFSSPRAVTSPVTNDGHAVLRAANYAHSRVIASRTRVLAPGSRSYAHGAEIGRPTAPPAARFDTSRTAFCCSVIRVNHFG